MAKNFDFKEKLNLDLDVDSNFNFEDYGIVLSIGSGVAKVHGLDKVEAVSLVYSSFRRSLSLKDGKPYSGGTLLDYINVTLFFATILWLAYSCFIMRRY